VSISRDTPLAPNLLAFLLRSHFERLVRRGLDGGLNEVDEGHELARLMRRAASMMPAAGRMRGADKNRAASSLARPPRS
jgi:hypothetical protein